MPAHNYNNCAFIGNLGRDPELRYTSQGTPICSFSIAVNDRKKADGEWKDDTLWIKVQLWRNQAESASQYLSKGRPVLVEGRLGVEKWVDRDGKPQFGLVLNAEKYVSLGEKGDASPPKASKPQQTSQASSPDLPDLSDDDIPF